MSQVKILITAPVDTESGYGHKSREIVDAIIRKWKNDVRVVFLPWGHCATGALVKSQRYSHILKHKLGGMPQEGTRVPLHVHVGLPTEFSPMGEKNILFTSGVETDRISFNWIQAINSKKIDLIVVPSEYVKRVLEQSRYIYPDQSGNQMSLQINKPVVVVPESFDPEFLSGTVSDSFKTTTDEFFDSLPKKVFFTAGQIIPRNNLYDDRKNITYLIESFVKTFRGDKDKALLVKATGLDDSNITKREMTSYIKMIFERLRIKEEEAPPVVYLHGFYTDPELHYIMNHPKVISHVYLTHGEGFGRFILQSTLCKDKPIIVPRVGGHRDFTKGRRIKLVEGENRRIPQSAHMGDILIPESEWYCVNDNDVYQALKTVSKDHKTMDDKGRLYSLNASMYDLLNVQNTIVETVAPYVSGHKHVALPIDDAGTKPKLQKQFTLKPVVKP